MTAQIHNDLLGRPLVEGDCVAFSSGNSLHIGVVIKLTPKMVKVKVANSGWGWKTNKYPEDVVRVEGADVTMYLLKNKR